MYRIITTFIFLIIVLFNNIIFAVTADADEVAKQKKAANEELINESKQFEQIIEEYKKYVSSIPENVREEVITYRKAIAKINKKKRLLYQQLSKESQEYLKREQEYKKKLPLKRRSLIKMKKENKDQQEKSSLK
ncbi:MAG: hypothetical protein HRU35_00240 [Rickettsiaceae bacterium]|nr:hypothetical protein [Rickettsiaceae bacterium]